jgi:beta-lactamase superfamily II metal-dependent hydrolase
VGGAPKDVIAPPPQGELFSETNENSVAILLTYATARVLLAGDAEARQEEYIGERPLQEASYGHQSSETYTQSEPRLRALPAEGVSEVELALG